MKIRQDFITNSSSTSYIISMKEDFTLDNFLKAIGVDKNICLIKLFTEMFKIIDSNCEYIHKYLDCKKSIKSIVSEIADHYNYGDEISLIIKDLLENKRQVYMGEFGDCESPMENFLCLTSIIMHNEDIYFNAEQSGY